MSQFFGDLIKILVEYESTDRLNKYEKKVFDKVTRIVNEGVEKDQARSARAHGTHWLLQDGRMQIVKSMIRHYWKMLMKDENENARLTKDKARLYATAMVVMQFRPPKSQNGKNPVEMKFFETQFKDDEEFKFRRGTISDYITIRIPCIQNGDPRSKVKLSIDQKKKIKATVEELNATFHMWFRDF